MKRLMVDTEAAKYFITNNLMPILRELDGEIEDLDSLKRKLGSLNRYYSRNSNMLSDINSALREANGDYDKLQDFIKNFKSFIENVEEVDESLAKKFKKEVKEYCNTNGIETTEWYDTLLNFVQGALDIVGFIPVVGDIADLINGVISLFRGNLFEAAICLIAIIPLVGDSFKFLKYTDEAAAILKYGDEAVDIGGAIAKEGAQKASKKASKEFTEKAIKDPDAAKKMLDTTMDMGNGKHYVKNKKGYDFEFDINKTNIHPESREVIMAGCFLGETKVKTESGHTFIRDIKAGDKVLTVNEENGQEEYKEVKEVFIRSSNEICIIKIGNDIIKTTTGHLFKVKDKWWTAAVNIEKGDYLYSDNNEYLQVDEVHVEKNNYPSYVYNLSIDENHNYFVGEKQVLAHNMANMKSCSQPIEGVSKAIDIEEISKLLKTEPDTAFFWSGRTNGIGGADRAAEIAKTKGGVTLESTISDKNIKMPEWDFNIPDSIKAWEDASAEYAKQVSGEIRAVVGKELREGNIWENVELPSLKQNPSVSKITIIDPETGIEKIIFER